MRAGPAHRNGVGRAVDIYETPHGVHVAQTVAPALHAAQPQDPRENPVAAWMLRVQRRAPDLSRRTATDEHGATRQSVADLGAHDVQPARRALAAVLLTGAPQGGRHVVSRTHSATFEQ